MGIGFLRSGHLQRLSEFIGTCVSLDAVTLLDINNTVQQTSTTATSRARPRTQKDTFMGFRTATPAPKLAFCSMKYPEDRNALLPIEVTQERSSKATLPQATSRSSVSRAADAQLRAYVAEGEVLGNTVHSTVPSVYSCR